MDGFQVRELVIVRVDAGAEKKSCVPSVHDLVVAELDEVRLVLLVSRGDQAVHLGVVSWVLEEGLRGIR
jgi:hypothetical protein